jgi:ribosomal protein L11 methyltransferase
MKLFLLLLCLELLISTWAFKNSIVRTPVGRQASAASDKGLDSTFDTKEVLMEIDCNVVSPDSFTDFLFELGVSSVSIQMETEKDIMNDELQWAQLGKAASWNTAIVRAHVPSTFDADQLLSIMRGSGMPFTLQGISSLDSSRDWVSEVQKEWKPERVTDDLSITFPWHEEGDRQTPHHLVLEAGAAFGTGGHQTTQLCCRWLEREVKTSTNERLSLLDYGCGSAILALVALYYGCESADGTDIDIDSLHAARRNAVANGLSSRLGLYMAQEVGGGDDDYTSAIRHNALKGKGAGTQEVFRDVVGLDGREYPLVVANILAPILIALAPDMYSKTSGGGGKIALSGVIEKQARSVCEAYKQAGFAGVGVEQVLDGWVLITGTKS